MVQTAVAMAVVGWSREAAKKPGRVVMRSSPPRVGSASREELPPDTHSAPISVANSSGNAAERWWSSRRGSGAPPPRSDREPLASVRQLLPGVWEMAGHDERISGPGRAQRRRRTAAEPVEATAEPRAKADQTSIRDWARENGYGVSGRGRIARSVRDAYAIAH